MTPGIGILPGTRYQVCTTVVQALMCAENNYEGLRGGGAFTLDRLGDGFTEGTNLFVALRCIGANPPATSTARSDR